jgi:monoterpene epsilon-lactone hydrolase
MPSFRAIVLNKMLRVTVNKGWQPNMKVSTIRKRFSAAALVNRRPAKYSTLVTTGCNVDRMEVDGSEKPLVLLYLHGGGFCWHDAPMYRGFVARLCRTIGATGYLPDYRLAPEHQFPAAVNDSLETYRWLLEQPGVDPRRLVLAGDSAGGSLLLTTLMQARDQGLPLPACAVALCPLTDATGTGSSLMENAKRDVIFTPEALGAIMKLYLPESNEPADPLVSPLLGDLQGLPPLLLQVGEPELLRDDSVRFADKIVQSGGVVDLEVWDGMPHTFQLIPWLPEGNQALQKIADFVRKHTVETLGPNSQE